MSSNFKKIENYNFAEVEKKWRKKWENQSFPGNENLKNKYYVLEMFPYPSGYLHMGHVLNYTIGDVVARYKKMNGFDVIRPMGWDAFGLPAENAAIERGRHPAEWTDANIEKMRAQIKELGLMIDWSREIATCKPEYYKHEQKMFIDFYNNGLAYQKESVVNWDPIDQTVLANEQVVDGKGWRSGAMVEKKNLKQWFLKITDYSEELLSELENLPEWPEKIRLMQKNWIGKSEGAEVDFELENAIFTEDFFMRPINEGDLDLLFLLYNDEELMEFTRPLFCKTKDEAKKWLENDILDWKNQEIGQFMIFSRKTGEFIGRGGNSPLDLPDYQVAMGYILRKKFHGLGFGTKIANIIAARTFEKYHYDKIGIAIAPGNTASEKIASKIGAKYDKELNIMGHKMVNYLLTRGDFLKAAEFQTEHFIIREFADSDAENLLKLHADADVMRYVGSPSCTLDEARSSIEKYKKWRKDWGFSPMAVFCKKTGELAGRIGITKFDPEYPERCAENSIEIGYLLHKKFWGRGLGEEIARYVANFAFSAANTEKIYIMTAIENIASEKIASKIGAFLEKEVETDKYGKERRFVLNKTDFKSSKTQHSPRKITVFTTRIDTLFGCSFVAIAPDHPIAQELAKNDAKIAEFIKKCKLGGVSEAEIELREKEGVFTGIYVENPAISLAKSEGFEVENRKIPVWIANFVLMEYGTGAVFGCPAHDERDFEFAKKYNLPIKNVVSIEKNVVFETDRFYVRKFANEDFAAFLALEKELWNNPFTPYSDCEIALGCEKNTAKKLENYVNFNGKFSTFAIIDKTSREFVGKVNIDCEHSQKTLNFYGKNDIDLGYAMLFKFQNRGIATEVAIGAVKYLQKCKENARILATHKPENLASKRVLEKIGFKYIGQIETEGEFSFYEFPEQNIATDRLLIQLSCENDEAEIAQMYAESDDLKFFQGYELNAKNDVGVQHGCVKFTIRDRKTGEFIGRAQIGDFDNQGGGRFFATQETEFTYFIKKKHRGQGFGSEILRAICEFSLIKLGKSRIVAVIDPKNCVSKSVLEKCGFMPYLRGNFEKFGEELCFILERANLSENCKKPMCDQGFAVNSCFLNNLPSGSAKKKMLEMLEKSSKAKEKITYRLKDWGVSRQRYWGCPIPVVYCEKCGTVPEKVSNLPVKLPEDVVFDGRGNPLANHPTWKYCACPVCGEKAVRETDTFDTFFESSWYFLRFLDPKNSELAFDPLVAKNLMPVDQYIGGAEHAVMHLLYARFFTKALARCGYFAGGDLKNNNEPFARLLNQGMVLHRTYRDSVGNWVYPSEIYKKDGKFYHETTNQEIVPGDVIKMSKSKRNVVDPADVLELYGADAIRLFMLSDSPVDRDLEWSSNGVEVCLKYVNKLWKMANNLLLMKNDLPLDKQSDLYRKTHKTIQEARFQMEKFGFNKTIAKVRELHNAIDAMDFTNSANHPVIFEAFRVVILLLNPIIPHICSEISAMLNISLENYPQFDSDFIKESTVKMAVQVNGKVRAEIVVPVEISDENCVNLAIQEPNVQKYICGGTIKKTVVVKGRLVSISVV